MPSSFKAICRTSNGRQILETLNTSTRGRIFNRQTQVLELVADGVCQVPVLGGTGIGASLENLGSGLIHVVTSVGNQTGGNAQRVFVPRQALEEIAVLGVVGGRRRMLARGAESQQIKLFSEE